MRISIKDELRRGQFDSKMHSFEHWATTEGPTHAHTRTHTSMCTHKHMCTHAYIRPYTWRHIDMYLHTLAKTHTHIYYSYITVHAHTHTHAHTCTHLHTHILSPKQNLKFHEAVLYTCSSPVLATGLSPYYVLTKQITI